PAYNTPLLVGTTACELTSEECWVGYGHRWPVETNFYVAQDTTAMEMPRAWTATALERRISVALLAGSLLKAIAAVCVPQAMGPWDRQPVRSAGRLANWPRMSERVMSGKLAILPSEVEPLTSVLSTQFFTLAVAISKDYLHVPQAVPLSMCHPICVVRGFGTGLLGDSLPLASV